MGGGPLAWNPALHSTMQEEVGRIVETVPSLESGGGAVTRSSDGTRCNVVLAVAAKFWARGDARGAACVLMAHHCYGRTGELLKAQKKDLLVGRDGRGVLSLGVTKGRRIEMVTIDHPFLGKLLAARARGLLPGDRLLGVSDAEFSRGFAEIIRALRLERMEYKPHS